MKSETKPVALHFRVTQQVREAVDRAAMEDGRTVSQYANRVLEEHLRERGYLSDAKGTKTKNAR